MSRVFVQRRGWGEERDLLGNSLIQSFCAASFWKRQLPEAHHKNSFFAKWKSPSKREKFGSSKPKLRPTAEKSVEAAKSDQRSESSVKPPGNLWENRPNPHRTRLHRRILRQNAPQRTSLVPMLFDSRRPRLNDSRSHPPALLALQSTSPHPTHHTRRVSVGRGRTPSPV